MGSTGKDTPLSTRGARSIIGLVDGDPIEIPTFCIEAQDTTGAGDVFHGAFLHGLLSNWPVDRILRFAAACAALTITRRGGPERIPDAECVERFLR